MINFNFYRVGEQWAVRITTIHGQEAESNVSLFPPEITDEEIKEFDRIYHGVDWGYYPDKYAYTKSYFDAARRKLYIYDEYCCNKKSNKETYTELVENHGVTPNDLIICDSA